MPKLPDNKTCCGCAACVDSCNHNAITLTEDKNGFYNIVINKDSCVECKLCENRCHILQQEKLQRNDPLHAESYAGWSLDEEVIRRSATGGAFAEIAKDFLSQPNSVVYGAELMDDSVVRHSRITKKEEIKRLQNSKYQQSYAVGIYSSVLNDLKSGRRVLFSGVPCQVSALYMYLNYNARYLEHLYTIEVLCHGVPSNILHRFALEDRKAKNLVAYRNKDNFGWLYGRSNKVSYRLGNGDIQVCKDRRSDFLFRSYLSFSFSRNSCNSCKYADIHRISDITLFDFWGFEKSKRKENYNNSMGCSVILANSIKGKELVRGTTNMHLTPVSWREFLPYNQNLFMPTNKHLYKGANLIHYIIKLPKPFQKFVFQNGFTNSLLDRLYQKIMRVLFYRKKRRINSEINIKSNQVLKYLEK